MDKYFIQFLDNITLTSNQAADAQVKYTGVCETLYKKYYSGTYNESKKFLFGSYKTKTNIRPLTDSQDVDVIFKISQETFDKFDAYGSNGQSALLQEIRDILKEKYTTTDKISGWGKVVLVKFSDGHHNVEVLPALELENKTFKIPNSENGGSWEIFDPRAGIDDFTSSNTTSDGLTRVLVKIFKTWVRNTSTLCYKSCMLMEDVIAFISEYYESGKGNTDYAIIVKDFFDYLKNYGDATNYSYFKTAYDRSIKAIEYSDANKPKEASEEWRKIFGGEFPLIKENPDDSKEKREITNPARPWCN